MKIIGPCGGPLAVWREVKSPPKVGWCGSVAQELGQSTKAVIALRRALAMNPKDEARVRLELAKQLMAGGERAQAMREVANVLTREPWNVDAQKLDKELREATPPQ